MHTSAQWAEHMQEAEPGSNWPLGVCTSEVAEGSVLKLPIIRHQVLTIIIIIIIIIITYAFIMRASSVMILNQRRK